MKSKTKKSDKKSNASRGQGSAQHRMTSGGVRTPSPSHDTTLSTTVVTPDASPLPGGHSLTVRITSKNPGRKSCEPTGNGHLLKEGSEVTGSEPVGMSLVLAAGSDTAPEVVEGPEMKQGFFSVEGPGNNHQTPPAKRMKMMNRETLPSSSSSAERCNAGVLTDPDCLGPCDPGSSVILEGIVWNESRNGLLVVNVTWRGKTYVGTLMDSTNHNWASPSFREDSLSNDNNSSSRDEDGVAMAPEGRRLRRCRTMQPSNGVMATASTASSSSASTTSTSSKTSTTHRTKCRIQVGDNSVQTDPVNLQQALNGSSGGGAGVLCPELHCQRKFKHEAALRNHRFRAHKATDSIAMSAFATSSAAAVVTTASASQSIVDDSGGSASTAQSIGPSLLLPTKQRCFDGEEEDVSSVNGGRVIKRSEDGARLCMEKDGEVMEADCLLIKSASGMENNKLDCFVPSRCLQSTPVVCGGSVQLSSGKLPMSTEIEKSVADASVVSRDCPVSQSAVPMRDSGECITDKQKMRNGAKKKCKGKSDRMHKNSESVVSLAGLASQTFGQPLTAEPHATAGAPLLQGSEDKHSAKRLLSVSLNRIPIENDSSLTPRKSALATEARSDDRSQDADKKGSSCTAGVDSTVRGLGLDVAKLCIVSGYGSCAGRDTSAAETSSQNLLAMREAMGRCPGKNQMESNCHQVLAVKAGSSTHVEEIAKPLLESCLVLPGKGQNGSDCLTRNDRAVTPSLLVFRSSKTCHDKIVAPSIVRDGNQKQTGLHSGSSMMFAASSSKSLLDHVGKESMPGSHLLYTEKTKSESTNSAKGIQNSTFCMRTSTIESIGSQTIKQKCPSFSNPDQATANRGTAANSAAPSGGASLIGSGPTTTPYTKDMLCDLNSFTNVQKDFSDLKGIIPSRSTIPFAVPPGSRSIPNGNVTWTTSPFVSSMSSLQHTAGSNTSSDPQTSCGSTYVTALASSMSSSLTPDCSFVPFCRAIQGAPATTSLPKQLNKFCTPSPPLASCPLEANTASEVFVRRDDGSWTSATVGKGVQHSISTASCPERSVLVGGGVSLPVPLQPPSSSSSSSLSTDLHYGGVIPYQQKKEKLLSTLHTSAMKPQSSSTSRSLLTGHSVQAACPK